MTYEAVVDHRLPATLPNIHYFWSFLNLNKCVEAMCTARCVSLKVHRCLDSDKNELLFWKILPILDCLKLFSDRSFQLRWTFLNSKQLTDLCGFFFLLGYGHILGIFSIWFLWKLSIEQSD